MKKTHRAMAGWFVLAAVAPLAQAQEAPADAQALVELRNTVVNLLEGLVQRGIITREDAQQMVADAQQRAEADAAAARAQEGAEQGAVRVTYVPEIVKEDIEAAVRADVQPAVVEDVVARAKAEGWGVPGALPEWVRNIDFGAALRVRGEGQYFDEQNATNTYLDFQTINQEGGIGLAGPDALMNTTEDRSRLRARLRLDVAAHITPTVTAQLAVSTGNMDDPISMNETLANYGRRLNFAVQDASINWNIVSDRATRAFELHAGRFSNPFLSTSLLWDVDLSFEGVAGRVAFDVFRRGEEGLDPGIVLTLGAFPLEEVELADDDKWLYGGQIGLQIPITRGGSYFRLASAYYEFRNIVGLRNAPDSRINDYTAPALLARGNTLFDIRNDLDNATNLFALAADYHIANLTAQLDFAGFGESRVTLTADYVENRGYDLLAVESRLLEPTEARTKGRQIELGVGRSIVDPGDWRVFAAYRYLERDAVVDAFTDSDFALGGTDNEGYFLGFDLAVARNTWLTTKWLTSNEIDGPPLSIDVLQIDLNTRF
jgi:putative porin